MTTYLGSEVSTSGNCNDSWITNQEKDRKNKTSIFLRFSLVTVSSQSWQSLYIHHLKIVARASNIVNKLWIVRHPETSSKGSSQLRRILCRKSLVLKIRKSTQKILDCWTFFSILCTTFFFYLNQYNFQLTQKATISEYVDELSSRFWCKDNLCS